MGKFIDLTNRVFGDLTVIKKSGKNKTGHYVWLCKCNCGNKKTILGYSLSQGKVNSCGCKQGGPGISRNAVHGLSRTPEYNSWMNMVKRCTYPLRLDYKYYGGRGIKVCKRWLKFETFLKDMGKSNGLTIDRINNNGHYKPSNCRWATRLEQRHNQNAKGYLKNESP